MNIYEKVSIYTAKDYGDNATLADIDRKSNAHYDQICDIMRNMGKDDNGTTYQLSWTSEEISPAELQEAVQETDKESLFNEVLTDSYEKNIFLEQFTIITKKDIDDNLYKEQQQAEKEQYSNQFIKDIKQLDSIKDFIYSWESEFVSAEEVYLNEEWAFKELHSKEEEVALFNNLTTEHIKNKEFEIAYSTYREHKKDDDNLDRDFMREVIKEHKTDTETLISAVEAITIAKRQSPEFMAKLLQGTLQTPEYRNAFEREQSKTAEYTR